MTKKDLKAVAIGTGVGLLLGGLIYYFGVKRKKLIELNPVEVKWESANG